MTETILLHTFAVVDNRILQEHFFSKIYLEGATSEDAIVKMPSGDIIEQRSASVAWVVVFYL
jgi:hypothetical protein